MKWEHVAGRNKGQVRLYALSTCGWCKKTKKLLDDLGAEYDFVFVDMLDEKESESARAEISKWNPNCSFPTMVVNEQKCIVGFDETTIRETLG
jgi:glutaredoxin-like protein NrdH